MIFLKDELVCYTSKGALQQIKHIVCVKSTAFKSELCIIFCKMLVLCLYDSIIGLLLLGIGCQSTGSYFKITIGNTLLLLGVLLLVCVTKVFLG